MRSDGIDARPSVSSGGRAGDDTRCNEAAPTSPAYATASDNEVAPAQRDLGRGGSADHAARYAAPVADHGLSLCSARAVPVCGKMSDGFSTRATPGGSQCAVTATAPSKCSEQRKAYTFPASAVRWTTRMRVRSVKAQARANRPAPTVALQCKTGGGTPSAGTPPVWRARWQARPHARPCAPGGLRADTPGIAHDPAAPRHRVGNASLTRAKYVARAGPDAGWIIARSSSSAASRTDGR